MSSIFESLTTSLGTEFGHLDNQVEKWVGLEEKILSCLPGILDNLIDQFPDGSAPIQIFNQADKTYRELLATLSDEEEIANGYLNLRFYIMLNGFLAACKESLEKASHNHSLDPVSLVEKSYYTPYFFARVAYTKQEILALLKDDIHQLKNTPAEQKGVLLALRIRKGTVLTLTENYCPLHPRLYPLVAALDQVKISKDPAVILKVLEKLTVLQEAIA